MSLAVRQALFAALKGDAGITDQLSEPTAIFHEQAKDGAEFPYVIFAKAAGTKTRAFQDPNAWKRETWMVKGVDRDTSSNLAEGIGEAIDELLDGGTLVVAGKAVDDLYHVGDIDYVEAAGDQQYRHNGANYRVVLSST